MAKFNQNKKKGGGQSNKQDTGRTSARESKCVLQYTNPKLSSNTISAKFKNSEGEEVKETIHIYSSGDKGDCLIDLQYRIWFTLANRYDYFKDGKAKMLSQTYGRALDGDAEEEWSNLVETITNWDHNTIKTVMKRKLQEHVMKVLGKKVFDQQQDAMEAGMVKPQGMGHVKGINVYTQ